MFKKLPLFAVILGLFLASPFGFSQDDKEKLKEEVLSFNKITQEKEMEKKLKSLLKNKAETKKLVAEAAKIFEEDKKALKINTTIAFGKLASIVKDYTNGETFLQHSVSVAIKQQNEKRLVDSHVTLIRMYMASKEYAKAEAWCQKFFGEYNLNEDNLELNRAGLEVHEYEIMALAKQGEKEKAMEKIETLTSQENIGIGFFELKARVQAEFGKYDDAVKTMKEFIEKIEDLDRLDEDRKNRAKRSAQYQMTSYLTDLNKLDEVEKILKQLIEDDSENPSYYNDLGFVWADNDKNIEEAEKYCRKAIDLEEKQLKKLLDKGVIEKEDANKKNAAYLDSLGWVLFKKKDYEEAKKYLIEATKDEDEGNHLEIWDHLADVYMATGDKNKAIETWQKALKMDDISKKDAERRKKVSEKMKKAKEAK